MDEPGASDQQGWVGGPRVPIDDLLRELLSRADEVLNSQTLPPAAGSTEADTVARIVPELITGYRLQALQTLGTGGGPAVKSA